MQVVDANGNIYGNDHLEINDANGKPKTTGGGGAPSGPAGGDLSGTYPNPSVVWNNGTGTYDIIYYPLSTNPAGYLTSGSLSSYLTIASAALTYYPIPTGTISQYIRGNGTLATFPTIPTVGTWGALNYPSWGSGTPFVKMTAAGTFALDTNTYQGSLTLTTTGTSGASTLIGNTLNIPQYGGGGGGGTIYKLTSQTLTVASWVLASGYYTYTFSNVNITTNTRVDFTPDNASYIEVTTCGLTTQVTVAAGTCTFYSIFPPQNNITGEITIFPTV